MVTFFLFTKLRKVRQIFGFVFFPFRIVFFLHIVSLFSSLMSFDAKIVYFLEFMKFPAIFLFFQRNMHRWLVGQNIWVTTTIASVGKGWVGNDANLRFSNNIFINKFLIRLIPSCSVGVCQECTDGGLFCFIRKISQYLTC